MCDTLILPDCSELHVISFQYTNGRIKLRTIVKSCMKGSLFTNKRCNLPTAPGETRRLRRTKTALPTTDAHVQVAMSKRLNDHVY